MTLIRNVVILKLSRFGYKIRSFMSPKGDKIMVLITANEMNLKCVAE
jgi:hypothetical protein